MFYTKKGRGLGFVADTAKNVTKNDSTVQDVGQVYVGYAGTLVVLTADDQTVYFNVPAGTVVPVLAKVIATATTASGIVMLY